MTGPCLNEDSDKQCDEWASRGECEGNSEYMHINCRKSCKLCQSTSGGVGFVVSEGEFEGGLCTAYWRLGNLFAGAWTLWRLEISLWTRRALGCLLENIFVAPSSSSSSKKAIFLCLPMATFLLLPVRVNAAPTFRISQPAPCSPWCVFSLSIGLIYSRESRLVFRKISLRDLNIFFLRYDFPEGLKTGCKWDVTPNLETLQHICWLFVLCPNFCLAGPCENAYDEKKCTDWAATGECQKNSMWMRSNCRKACDACKPGNVSEQVNGKNGESCSLLSKLRWERWILKTRC